MSYRRAYSLSASLILTKDGLPRQAALARALREAILSGALRHGERLPSSRALAYDLGLSRNTVVQALDRLSAEGLIEGRQGSGTFIAARMQGGGQDPKPRHASRRARALPAPGPGGPTQPLTPGIPALDAFPGKIWARLSSKWARTLSFSELDYGDPAGISALRQAIAVYIGAARGVVCKSEQVIVTSGSQGALATAAFLAADHGDAILVENPGYVSARSTLQLAGLKLVPRPLDDEGLTLPDAPGEARLALVAPSHHYPLGIAMSLKRRMELLEWARANGGFVIEDDYDGEYRYDGHPLPALASLDRDGAHVLYAGTLSKVLSPSLRLGFLVVPDSLADDARRIRAAVDRGAPVAIQAVAADFIADGHLGLHIRKTQALYSERRARLAACLDDIGLAPLGSPAGLHMTVRLSGGHGRHGGGDRAVCARLAKLGLGGNPLSAYFGTNPSQHPDEGLVLGFANATGDVPERARNALSGIALPGG